MRMHFAFLKALTVCVFMTILPAIASAELSFVRGLVTKSELIKGDDGENKNRIQIESEWSDDYSTPTFTLDVDVRDLVAVGQKYYFIFSDDGEFLEVALAWDSVLVLKRKMSVYRDYSRGFSIPEEELCQVTSIADMESSQYLGLPLTSYPHGLMGKAPVQYCLSWIEGMKQRGEVCLTPTVVAEDHELGIEVNALTLDDGGMLLSVLNWDFGNNGSWGYFVSDRPFETWDDEARQFDPRAVEFDVITENYAEVNWY